jgi:ribonucleoside-diphosphate reductase alpha chain
MFNENLVKNRQGNIVDFDWNRIFNAIQKASNYKNINVDNYFYENLKNYFKQNRKTWEIEEIQEIIINSLIQHYPIIAKSYIKHKKQHSKLRNKITPQLKELYRESAKYFPNDYAYFVYLRTYAQTIDNRRECWSETVKRYMNFMKENMQEKISFIEYDELEQAILHMEIMPSMRLLQFAGPAVTRNNIVAYNCCYVRPTNIKDLVDIMYILMCGTGVGYSVQDNIKKFPIPLKSKNFIPQTYQIEDSREGWCNSFEILLEKLFVGEDITFDYSIIRPAGSLLKTSGGTASGPQPLFELHQFTRKLIQKVAIEQRQLTTLEIHDLLCMVAQIVVVGGVRRAAMISLSDVNDPLMEKAKSGEWYINHSYRMQANNSAVYKEKPSIYTFMQEWNNLVQSRSGERGIFSLSHIKYQLPQRRLRFYQENNVNLHDLGTNPCGEIILRDAQFCNLASVICRHDDNMVTLSRKIKLATLLGTYQATLTNFKYVDARFQKHTEQERLLGISLAGQMGCPVVQDPLNLQHLKQFVVHCNKKYAKRFNIPISTATTCVKPDGTLSAITGVTAGLHCAKAEYYWRRVRHLAKDPLSKLVKDQGLHNEPCAVEASQGKDIKTLVFRFPIKSPIGSKLSTDTSALQQCKSWLNSKLYWCEHNPSVTIEVKDEEWFIIANWLYENWQYVGGMAFSPVFDNTSIYAQLPYEEISKEVYDKAILNTPRIDYSKLVYYDIDNQQDLKAEIACGGDTCLYG